MAGRVESWVPYLVLCGCLFGESLHGWHADSQVEATDIEHLSILYLLPDAVLLQVVDLVIVGSGKICAQRAVVAGDDNTATSRGCLLVVEVLGLDASFARDALKSLAIFVLADAADVYSRVRSEHVLCTTGSVLRGTTSDEDGLVVLDQVLIQAHVLLWVGQNGIIGLQTILVEQCLITGFR